MFFIFDLEEINSNSDKKLLYNLNNIHEENYYKIYLKNVNTIKLKEIINILDLDIISYGIDKDVYYSKNIDLLLKDYSKNLSLEDKLNYEIKGINVDFITTRCEIDKIIKLEDMGLIY